MRGWLVLFLVASIARADDAMVPVPAGSFVRGARSDDGERDVHPKRTIELDAFRIDRTEVTQAAYAACVAAHRCRVPDCADDPTDWDPKKRGDHPVVCVAWQDAVDYCTWAGKRLPTESEWEKAARGPDGLRYPWGDDEPSCDRAVYFDCGDRDHPDSAPVGSKPAGASPYGALDMAGNVWEWVADWYLEDYYLASPSKNPEGPWAGTSKVWRGGAFQYGVDDLSSTARAFDDPTTRTNNLGFRCAK